MRSRELTLKKVTYSAPIADSASRKLLFVGRGSSTVSKKRGVFQQNLINMTAIKGWA
jgi:hypothetical protein